MTRRILGDDSEAVSAIELPYGSYNSTYRVEVAGRAPMVLRVAPPPRLQFESEREFMRNEYAVIPFLASLAHLLPETIGADFTRELIGRDYLLQSLLPGVPAPELMGGYERSLWPGFFAQIARIARAVHSVRGRGFGPAAEPSFPSWSEALASGLVQVRSDLVRCDLEAEDITALLRYLEQNRELFDEITVPHLLHGDLWTANIMLQAEAAEPRIVGVCDSDRALWGDPAADWTIYRARARPEAEQDAFWSAYGEPSVDDGAQVRQLFYEARHLAAVRLESFRARQPGRVAETYEELAGIVKALP